MYALLLLSVLAASSNSVVLRLAKIRGMKMTFAFNGVVSAVLLAILLFINGFRVSFTPNALLFGALYGVVQTVFIFSKTAAMNSGSVTVTTLVGNCSLIISVAVSSIAWGEYASVPDIIGMLLLVGAIVLSTYKKSRDTYTRAWKYYCFIFLLSGAGVGLCFKAFGKTGSVNLATDMMIVAGIVMVVLNTAFALVLKNKCEERWKLPPMSFGVLSFAICCGALSCLYNRLNVYLSANLDGIIFFPFFNGGVILLSGILGAVVCKERFNIRKIFGTALGIGAIAVIGLF